MVTVYDVEQGKLVVKVAEKLKADKDCNIPEWVYHVKTGHGRVRIPDNPEWWYERLASVLRLVYKNPQIGVSKLKTHYGGRKNRGHAPEKRVDAGGKIIRVCLQQLVELGLLEKGKLKGRVVSAKGQALIDNSAYELAGSPKPLKVKKVSDKASEKKSKSKELPKAKVEEKESVVKVPQDAVSKEDKKKKEESKPAKVKK